MAQTPDCVAAARLNKAPRNSAKPLLTKERIKPLSDRLTESRRTSS